MLFSFFFSHDHGHFRHRFLISFWECCHTAIFLSFSLLFFLFSFVSFFFISWRV